MQLVRGISIGRTWRERGQWSEGSVGEGCVKKEVERERASVRPPTVQAKEGVSDRCETRNDQGP